MSSKNLTIMLTDLQGYSSRSAEGTRSDIVDLVNTHNRLLRPVIEFYRGSVVKTMGDAFLCTFESATDAAICAIAIQVITKEYNARLRDSRGLVIRVALSSGDVSVEGEDIYGEAVNLVSRLEKIPEIGSGGIAMTESTYLLVNRQEIAAEPLGEKEFKGISLPVQVFRVDLGRQKLDRLPTRLLDLVKQVAEGREGFSLLEGKRWKGNALRAILLAGAVALTVFAAAPFVLLRKPDAQETKIFEWVRLGDSSGNGMVRSRDWVGPPEVFRELDENGDGIISEDEISSWARRKGIRVPGLMAIRVFWFG